MDERITKYVWFALSVLLLGCVGTLPPTEAKKASLASTPGADGATSEPSYVPPSPSEIPLWRDEIRGVRLIHRHTNGPLAAAGIYVMVPPSVDKARQLKFDLLTLEIGMRQARLSERVSAAWWWSHPDYLRVILTSRSSRLTADLQEVLRSLATANLTAGSLAAAQRTFAGWRRSQLVDPFELAINRATALLSGRQGAHIRPGLGLENLNDLSLEAVREYREQLFQAHSALLVVVGDVDRTHLVDLANRIPFHRSAEGRAGGDHRIVIGPSTASEARFHVERQALPTNVVAGIFGAPPPGDPQHAAVWVTLNALHERLDETLRAEQGTTAWVSAGSDYLDPGSAMIWFDTAVPLMAIRQVIRELGRFARVPIEEPELKAATAVAKTEHLAWLTNTKNSTHALALGELYAGNVHWAHRYVDELERVTSEDVQNAAKLLLKTPQFAIVGPAEGIPDDGPLTALLDSP